MQKADVPRTAQLKVRYRTDDQVLDKYYSVNYQLKYEKAGCREINSPKGN